jgi:hypothetical protein
LESFAVFGGAIGERMSLWRRIKFYIISAIILALAGSTLYFRCLSQRGGVIHRTLDPPAIVKEIQNLSQLVSVKYTVQKMIGLTEEKVPFGEEKLSLMVQAQVLAGVDLSALTDANVSIAADKSVAIKLPQPRILHVFIDEKQTKVWDRQKTWWTPWVPFNPELDQKARLAALEAVQAAALEMGILKDAQHNAETAIRQLLKPLGIETVTFASE